MADKVQLIAEAQRKGFEVFQNEEGTAWLVKVPARPRRPSETLGDYASSERAWMGACLIAQDMN